MSRVPSKKGTLLNINYDIRPQLCIVLLSVVGRRSNVDHSSSSSDDE